MMVCLKATKQEAGRDKLVAHSASWEEKGSSDINIDNNTEGIRVHSDIKCMIYRIYND